MNTTNLLLEIEKVNNKALEKFNTYVLDESANFDMLTNSISAIIKKSTSSETTCSSFESDITFCVEYIIKKSIWRREHESISDKYILLYTITEITKTIDMFKHY